MFRTHTFACSLPRDVADTLNQESGRIYSRVLVTHYRAYRQSGIWLSKFGAKRLDDFYGADEPRLLHSTSIDAAQEAFYNACKTAKANRAIRAHYPYQRKSYRTTIWKKSAIRIRDSVLLLSRARGIAPLNVRLPTHLVDVSAASCLEMRLVWDRAACRYDWHLVVNDGQDPPQAPGENVAGVDLGEIHPAAVSDGAETVIFSARQLRSVRQQTHKRLAELRQSQDAKRKGSRTWKRLQRRKNRFLGKQKRRARDIQHKVSRAVVDWAIGRQVGTLAIGDVRDVANGKRFSAKSQQKLGNWSHGQMRQYIEYKAAGAGIVTLLLDEAYTSQTCPVCGHRHKPTGRMYHCPACGFCGPRDAVGAANIRSRQVLGELGRSGLGEIKYRHPFSISQKGKRSRPDTAQVAWAEPPPP